MRVTAAPGRGGARAPAVRRLLAGALAGMLFCTAASAQARSYSTEDCLAFWRLMQRLEADGVAERLEGEDAPVLEEISQAQLERIRLYLRLGERLLFRCPEFAPPPVRRPSREDEDSG
jgi:hypothetical protein